MDLRSLGYLFQKVDLGLCRSLEAILVRGQNDRIRMPLVSVCGPPRSGTTLTCQLVTQVINGFVLNNLRYLFYRTPYVGYHVSRLVTRPYVSDFRSSMGFISGLNGPAQAMFFWQYWCDLGLNEREAAPDPARLKKLAKSLNAIYEADRRPMVTHFLGHVFYVDLIRAVFDRCVFVRTNRDMLATALSIVKSRRRPDGTNLPFPVLPYECQEECLWTPHKEAARQVFFINQRLDAFQQKYGDDMMECDYEETCRNPSAFADRLCAFLKAKGVEFRRRTDVELLPSFTPTVVARDQDEDTLQIARHLDALMEK